jgi:hypothetical protein
MGVSAVIVTMMAGMGVRLVVMLALPAVRGVARVIVMVVVVAACRPAHVPSLR